MDMSCQHEDILRKVEETIELGGSGILHAGWAAPGSASRLLHYAARKLEDRYADSSSLFLADRIYGLAKTTGISYDGVFSALRDSGLDSLPGGGGEILVDEIRRKRRTECSGKEVA